MKPVSIMWTQGVDTTEAQHAVSAVREFLREVYAIGHRVGLALPPTAIRPFGTWYIPSIPQGSPYSGTSWYIDSSYDRERQQVIGARFLELVREEPWQKSNPHWDVAVIDRDLVEGLGDEPQGDRGNFALGAAIPELATVLSVYRLRGLVRPEQRELALRRLVLHQFGQVLGLPSAAREEEVARVGKRRYCTNLCVMRRAGNVDQLVRAAEQEGRDRVRLCERCRRDVVHLIVRRSISPN
jgi:predicted Zn-dependent protease